MISSVKGFPGRISTTRRISCNGPLERIRRSCSTAGLIPAVRTAGLKPAATLELPYEMPATNFARAVDEGPRLAALAAWFAAGAGLLEELRHKYKRFQPGPTPTRCWPHHFDLATVVELGQARSIGIGLSPGDDYYAQPYFYLSPYPKPARNGARPSAKIDIFIAAVKAVSTPPPAAATQICRYSRRSCAM